ncbi:MAG: Gfo/Idh/MocA family protein [Bacilli bacterium]
MGELLNIGVIGCGSIAQQMHLPYLNELSGYFKIDALCDVSQDLVSAMGRKYHAPFVTTEYRQLLKRDLDAVLVCISIPAEEVILDALNAGFDVFCEKPMAWSPSRAKSIVDTVHQLDRIMMVGYMKRYDPGYQLGQNLIQSLNDVKLVLVHDIAGPNDPFIADVTDVIRATDIPPAQSAIAKKLVRECLEEVVGRADTAYWNAYTLLLGLCSHDMAILRGILGQAASVESCHVWHDGRFISGTLRYPTCPVSFEAGLVSLKKFDERLEVFSEMETVSIHFPSPFLKNAPTLVNHSYMVDGYLIQAVKTASYEEAFRRELIHFHECVVDHKQPVTTCDDAYLDTELMARMIHCAMRSENQEGLK